MSSRRIVTHTIPNDFGLSGDALLNSVRGARRVNSKTKILDSPSNFGSARTRGVLHELRENLVQISRKGTLWWLMQQLETVVYNGTTRSRRRLVFVLHHCACYEGEAKIIRELCRPDYRKSVGFRLTNDPKQLA